MKHPSLDLLAAFSMITALGSFTSASAVEIPEEIAANLIEASASGTYPGQPPSHLTDSSGVDKTFGHDNNGNAATMWHTVLNSKPSAPAPGLPECPAWVRFDFKEPQTLGFCEIWNINQSALTNRGFRHARLWVSADGTTFEKLPVKGQEVFEIPKASGKPAEPSSFWLPLSDKPIKSVILAAEDNWG